MVVYFFVKAKITHKPPQNRARISLLAWKRGKVLLVFINSLSSFDALSPMLCANHIDKHFCLIDKHDFVAKKVSCTIKSLRVDPHGTQI